LWLERKNQKNSFLFKNRKYIFDKSTLQFKRAKLPFKDRFFRGLLGFAFSVALTIVYVSVFKSFFGAPKEKYLNQRLEGIKLNYSIVAKRLDNSEFMLSDLRLSDDIRYRPILDMDSVPETYRRVGVGGIDHYRNFAGYMNSGMLIHFRSKLDMVSNMANVQKESFKAVADKAGEWKVELEHLPLISPVDVKYRLSDRFHFRQRHPVLGTPSMHNGQDFAMPVGTEVYATGNGTVSEADRDGGLGIYIVIDHGYGLSTTYGHLSRIHVVQGAQVKRGDLIGLSGNTGLSTGPHLHYEVKQFGQYKNPINFFNNDITTEEYNEMIQVFASRYKLR
jgi:murein DD-endopeptidase MepM/ murein hydrolase activator NlpD